MNRIQIFSPHAGDLFAVPVGAALQFNLTVGVSVDSSWHYNTGVENLVNLLKVVLFDGTGTVVAGVVQGAVTPQTPAGRIPDNFLIPITVPQGTNWPTVGSTILVYLDGQRNKQFCRITVGPEVPGFTVQIDAPIAGSHVSFPFTAAGVADPSATMLGQLIAYFGGGVTTGRVIQGAPNWEITFDSGPSGSSTLRVTDTAHAVFAQEYLGGIQVD